MNQMWRRVAPARGSLPANLDSSVSRMRHIHMMLTFALMVRPAARACQVSRGEGSGEGGGTGECDADYR